MRWQVHRSRLGSRGLEGESSEGESSEIMFKVVIFHQKRISGKCLPAYTICFLSDLQKSGFSVLYFGKFRVKDFVEIPQMWHVLILRILIEGSCEDLI